LYALGYIRNVLVGDDGTIGVGVGAGPTLTFDATASSLDLSAHDFTVDTDVFKVDATSDIVSVNGTTKLGSAANYTQFSTIGNVTFAGSAGFYPRFLTQAGEPAAGTGATQLDTSEMCVWKDSDDNKVYFCFNDGGTVKIAEAA